MTEKCPICKEFLYEWRQHSCKTHFFVWEAEGGATFSDAYDSRSGHVYADNALAAAEKYSDFERSKTEVYVLADDLKAQKIIDDLAECDQTEKEIARINEEANKIADLYVVHVELVYSVSATLKSEVDDGR